MTLFSDPACHYSHRVRIVLAEKGVVVDRVEVTPREYPPELAELNPYGSLPVLVDRDLVLYESRAMMEYLDERYPHPSLLPVYPVARAENRQFLYRVERDWSARADTISNPRSPGKAVAQAREELGEELVAVAALFADKPCFLNDEYTLVDCCLSALFWRLPRLGVQLPVTRQTKPLHDYMCRMFSRPAFQESLSDTEKEMRPT
ncbi:MAG: glutathione S-transferase N-terminal domain-containing protein [Gammaproteobacteria bacterium]